MSGPDEDMEMDLDALTDRLFDGGINQEQYNKEVAETERFYRDLEAAS